MKDYKLIIILISLLVLAVFLNREKNNNIQTGDIAFIGFDATESDSFSIITFVDIVPNTTIFFTDSEWNGTHFGADESNLTWNSGKTTIQAGTTITFNNINDKPIINYGFTKNTMSLSKKGEALFAYIGDAPKLPNQFLAAVANNNRSYGTLINTGLLEGTTAITYPNGTYSAKFEKKVIYSKKEFLVVLNNMENYTLNNRYNLDRLAVK